MKYTLIQRKNLLNRSQAPKYYAQPCFGKKISGNHIAEEIAKCSCVNTGEVLSIFTDLAVIIPRYLREGYSVELPGIGIIRFYFSSTGIEKSEYFNNSLIKKRRIQFRPAGRLMQDINDGIRYSRVKIH